VKRGSKGMRKVHFLVVLFLILAIFLNGCGGLVTPETLSANIIITDWEQNYYSSWQEWSDLVKVWYKITNTGNVDIDYYQVWFTATCIDGSTYEDWTNGLFVDVGHYEFDYTFIDVPNKQVVSVKVTDWELENWGW